MKPESIAIVFFLSVIPVVVLVFPTVVIYYFHSLPSLSNWYMVVIGGVETLVALIFNYKAYKISTRLVSTHGIRGELNPVTRFLLSILPAYAWVFSAAAISFFALIVFYELGRVAMLLMLEVVLVLYFDLRHDKLEARSL